MDSTSKQIHPSSTPGVSTTTFNLMTQLLLQALHLIFQLKKSLLCLIVLFEVDLKYSNDFIKEDRCHQDHRTIIPTVLRKESYL